MAVQRISLFIPTWLRQLWQRRWVRRFFWRLPFVAGIFLLFWVIFPWLSYQTVAPSGWHNITLHGSISGQQYAVSHDDPGLMLACGDRTEVTLLFIINDVYHCWQTQDGGAQWNMTGVPPISDHSFYLVAPRADAATFFAIANNVTLQQPSPQAIYVTHDAGATWHQVTHIPGDGGDSWRGGPSQVNLGEGDIGGYSPSPVQAGNDGACYTAFTYQKASNVNGSTSTSGQFYAVILQLGPKAHRSTAVPLDSAVSLDPVGPLGAPNWWYVPAGHGRSARLVIHADDFSTSFFRYLSFSGESLDEFLFWRPMP